MRLVDLGAYFVGNYRVEDGHVCYTILDSLDGAQGVSFLCPKCAAGKPVEEEEGREPRPRRFVRGVHGIICWFRNPRNAPRVPDDADPKPGRWWVSAASTGIHDLTFEHGSPHMAKSVLLLSGCQWHGFVENGEAK